MNWMRCGLVLAVLILVRPAWADDKDEKKSGKGKGKGEAKPMVVQIDLAKLPPDLAKQLMKYASADTKPEKGPPPKAKEPAKTETPKGKGKAPQIQLPPGLAKKPANHPGRLHYIQHHAGQQPMTGRKGKY